MSSIRPAHYIFGSTADLATYCEAKAAEAHRLRLAASTQRESLIQQAVKNVYADLASLIREAHFESETAAVREP